MGTEPNLNEDRTQMQKTDKKISTKRSHFSQQNHNWNRTPRIQPNETTNSLAIL